MSKEEFETLIHEDIPSALFHVSVKDKDEKTGIKMDELILLEILAANPTALLHKDMAWFYQRFIVETEADVELNQGKSSDDIKSAISKVGHMLESFNNMLKDAQQSIKQTIRDFSDFNYLQGKNGLEPISWEDYLKEYGFSDEQE